MQDPTSDKSQGGGGVRTPPPPLDPHMTRVSFGYKTDLSKIIYSEIRVRKLKKKPYPPPPPPPRKYQNEPSLKTFCPVKFTTLSEILCDKALFDIFI